MLRLNCKYYVTCLKILQWANCFLCRKSSLDRSSHNDAVAVTLNVVKQKVRFVNMESSYNIIFLSAFKQIEINKTTSLLNGAKSLGLLASKHQLWGQSFFTPHSTRLQKEYCLRLTKPSLLHLSLQHTFRTTYFVRFKSYYLHSPSRHEVSYRNRVYWTASNHGV